MSFTFTWRRSDKGTLSCEEIAVWRLTIHGSSFLATYSLLSRCLRGAWSDSLLRRPWYYWNASTIYRLVFVGSICVSIIFDITHDHLGTPSKLLESIRPTICYPHTSASALILSAVLAISPLSWPSFVFWGCPRLLWSICYILFLYISYQYTGRWRQTSPGI